MCECRQLGYRQLGCKNLIAGFVCLVFMNLNLTKKYRT
ncbi:hypothetical protein MNBD_ALPHA11-478 [hydrothermal vent metagenome]|uniref:Uncharacterized protein n=1 Tax=hydrothermal vent metagenome TaxID=652676 RepID=A0A3B0URC6_9ZZZZ